MKFSCFFLTLPHIFNQDAYGFKQNLQHESCSPSQSLQLWFIKFSKKKIGSQVMIFWTRVPKTFNLEKFCPSLGRILTHLLGHFSHSSTWILDRTKSHYVSDSNITCFSLVFIIIFSYYVPFSFVFRILVISEPSVKIGRASCRERV